MKKVLCILLTTVMLFGCENHISIEDSSDLSVETSVSTEATENEEAVDVWVDENIYYDTVEEFESAYSKARDTEQPLFLKWNENIYELNMIEAHKAGYNYYLTSKSQGTNVSVSVCNNIQMTTIEELKATFGGNMSTAEIGGIEYDILLSKPDYEKTDTNYTICYIPAEGYSVSIYAGQETTQDEILEYFDDFELVEAQEE